MADALYEKLMLHIRKKQEEELYLILRTKNKIKMMSFLTGNIDCNKIIDKQLNYNLLMWMLANWPNWHLISKILSKEIDLTHISDDEDKNTALTLACKKHEFKAVFKMIEAKNCRPEYVNNKSQTALIIAINNELRGVIPELIKTFGIKTNPGHVNINTGLTAFMMICYQMSDCTNLHISDCMNEFIKMKEACNLGHVNNDGETAFMIAAKRDSAYLSGMMKEFGEELNPWHINKKTDATALKSLLKNDIRSVTDMRFNTFSYTKKFLEKFDINKAPESTREFHIEFLAKSVPSIIEVYKPTGWQKNLIMQLLQNQDILAKIRNVNYVYGTMLIKFAGKTYKNEEMQELIKLGMDNKFNASYVDEESVTPLIAACKEKHEELALEILKFDNCNITYIDNIEITACDYAVSCKMTKVANEIQRIIKSAVLPSLIDTDLLHKDLALIVCEYLATTKPTNNAYVPITKFFSGPQFLVKYPNRR